VLADIHGDIFALDAALGRLHQIGCDPILCAGDLIDIEPFGEEVVQRLKAEKVTCVLGNHDRWALQFRHRRQDARRFFEPCSVSDVMGSGAELSHESLVWLSTLPVHWEAELEGVRVAMWHARPGSDMEGIEKERTGPELRRRLLEQARPKPPHSGSKLVASERTAADMAALLTGSAAAISYPARTWEASAFACASKSSRWFCQRSTMRFSRVEKPIRPWPWWGGK
jgi:predicted phosphodiesterase